MIKFNGEENLLSGNNKILVFSADWCPDCIYLKNFIDEVVIENKDYTFIYIDTEEYQNLAKEYQILGIPSLIAINDNKIVSSLISKDRKTKSLITSWIKTIGVINND